MILKEVLSWISDNVLVKGKLWPGKNYYKKLTVKPSPHAFNILMPECKVLLYGLCRKIISRVLDQIKRLDLTHLTDFKFRIINHIIRLMPLTWHRGWQSKLANLTACQHSHTLTHIECHVLQAQSLLCSPVMGKNVQFVVTSILHLAAYIFYFNKFEINR